MKRFGILSLIVLILTVFIMSGNLYADHQYYAQEEELEYGDQGYEEEVKDEDAYQDEEISSDEYDTEDEYEHGEDEAASDSEDEESVQDEYER